MDPMDFMNKLIPADQMHWREGGIYSFISEEEAGEIRKRCDELSLTPREKLAIIVWHQRNRMGALLWENFMKGSLTIEEVKDDEPVFTPLGL